MSGHPETFVGRSCLGVGLVELLIAMFIGTLLLTGLIQVAASARSSFRLQEGLAEVQENGRFAMDSLAGILRQSKFSPQPWVETGTALGVIDSSEDELSGRGDLLAIRTWSERNCFDNLNPVRDMHGRAVFYLRESIIDVSSGNNLSHTCRYGASEDQFITQIRHQGLVQNVEMFQVQYAEDLEGDTLADRWVTAGQWSDPERVTGLKLALLISSTEAVGQPQLRSYKLLEQTTSTPPDGKLRRVFTLSHHFRNSH
jgi:type IV pilus assembly protein PilW